MDPSEIQGIFFAECEEALDAAEQGLDACRDGSQDDDTVNAIFRAVHSIKGGAGAFGFNDLQAYAHGFETLLSDVRDGLLPVDDELTGLLLRALDMLRDHVMAARGEAATPDDAELLQQLAAAQADGGGGHGDDHEEAPAAVDTPVEAEAEAEEAPVAEPQPEAENEEPSADDSDDDLDFDLDAMLDDIAGDFDLEEDSADADGLWTLKIAPSAGSMANGGEPMLLMRELERLGGECLPTDVSGVPALDGFDPTESYLNFALAMPADVPQDAVREVFDFVEDEYKIEFSGTPAKPAVEAAPQPVKAEEKPAEKSEATVAEKPAKQAAEPQKQDVAAKASDGNVTQLPVAKAGKPEKAAPAQTSAPAKATKPAAAAAAPAVTQSIRIELSKLDRLIDTVGELVIAQAMMAQRLSEYDLDAIEEIAMLDGLTRDIQESAMSIRAQPIQSVFSRVPRILRELEASVGKRVELTVLGETTELDKTVIEKLGEPLTHLIRNAVDHGIELPEERKAAGKSEHGSLCLSAEQKSGRIIIRITDDGRGINRDKVFEKAVEKGIVSADAQLADEEVYNLIFAPGFSTADTVSNVSGRGVGMDVVRQSVKDLGGRITIESTPGEGTSFNLLLPLTLAISDGMIVTVGEQTLVVPLAHVIESLRPAKDDIEKLGSGRSMLNVRGRFIPIVPMQQAVASDGGVTDPSDGVVIVVDTEAAGQAALLVDNIADQRQFVIKSLDTHYRQVMGVAGATILGDGRVALIVDVDGLVSQAVAAQSTQEAA